MAEGERIVRAMVSTMKHEPFYESGLCTVPELGVYAGYTAHRGSSAARQFAQGAHDGVTVILAGECADSENDGASVAQADAIARLYRQTGDAFVGRLTGLFSGLLIDRPRERALLFNDRYGLERLYVHRAPDAVYFASEAKALLRVLPELRAFDDQGVAQFAAYGCTRGGQTLFRGVRRLSGGTLWSFRDGRCREGCYFEPGEWESQPVLSAPAFESEFRDTFQRILPRYLESDSTIGISLTGGLDTRMIMASLRTSDPAFVCYTFSGQRERTLDERLAAHVAAACGLEHHVLRVGSDYLTNYGRYVDKTVWVTDGTAGALGAHEIYLNSLARRLAPVRLTGNFGSEVLRSVSTFKPTGLSPGLFRPEFSRLVGSVGQSHLSDGAHPVTFAAFRETPWKLFGALAAGRSQVTFRTPYLDNDLVRLAYRAPLESRRSPTAAVRLIEGCNATLARIPTDRGLLGGRNRLLHLMKRASAEVTFKLDYWHKEGLPDWASALEGPLRMLSTVGLLGLHKYLPYRLWFRQELSARLVDVLTDPRTARLPYWNAEFLPAMVRDHIAGRRNFLAEINTVLTLESIDRLLLRIPDSLDATGDDAPAHAQPAPRPLAATRPR